MDYRVHKAAASQAEVKLDIESAGHWFGGGALQHHVLPLHASAPLLTHVQSNLPGCFAPFVSIDALSFVAHRIPGACRASDAAAVAAEQSFFGDRALLPLRQWPEWGQHPGRTAVAD